MLELKLQDLLDMEPGKIFATGVVHNHLLHWERLRWIAKRGGIHDWAIYYHLTDKSLEWISENGDKCADKTIIQELVSCDKEAFGMYRF